MIGIVWSRQTVKRKRGAIWIMVGRLKRAGRPRKTNVVRDASGKSRGEIVDFSVVLNQPHRRGKLDPMSHLLGFPLGRLRLADEISDDQLRTGEAWAVVVCSYAAIIRAPSPHASSGSLAERVTTGGYQWAADEIPRDQETPETRERRIEDTRDKYNLCFERMVELGRVLGRGSKIAIAVRKVCIEQRHPDECELGDLRLGLNAIQRILLTGV